MNTNFNLNFKELRLINNLKQKDVAKLFNVTISTISGWETGRNQPSYEMLLNIANYFQISIDKLIGLKNEKFAEFFEANNNSNIQSLKKDEQYILNLYRSLIPDGKQLATKYLENMQEINIINKNYNNRKLL